MSVIGNGLVIFILLCLFISQTLTEEDFYKLLGVSKDADNRTIRRAFKKLALQKHPDKNPVSPLIIVFSLSFFTLLVLK